jgi:WD40 repeat protein
MVNSKKNCLEVFKVIKDQGSKFINAIDASPNGSLIATGDIEGAIKLYNTETGELMGKPFNNHGRAARCVKFSPGSDLVLSGGEDLHMYLNDVETG